MARNNHIMNSFIAGEVSPKFLGRTETQQYNQSAEDIRNFIIHPQGGASRRPGTQYISEILKTDGEAPSQVRIFPFTSSTDGSKWQIIMTEENVNNHHVTTGTTIDRMAWRVINIETETFEDVFPTSYEPDTENYLAIDWPAAPGWWDLDAKGVDLSEIQFTQAGDTMFFAHKKIRPFRIIYNPTYLRATHFYPPGFIPERAAFTMAGIPDLRRLDSAFLVGTTNYDAVRGMPMQPFRTDAILTVQGISGSMGNVGPVNMSCSITLTATALDLIAFDRTWIGRQMKFSAGGDTIGVVITGYLSTTVLYGIAISDAAFNGNVLLPVTANFAAAQDFGYGTFAANDSSWEEGYWNDTYGWPSTVCFFESRLVYGGNYKFPDKVWFSELNDVYQFDERGFEQDANFGTQGPPSPFSQDMKEQVVTSLKWLSAGKTIIAGTNETEFVILGPDSSKTIAIDNTSSNPETDNGSAYVQAQRFDGRTIFIKRNKKALHEMVFNLEENAFQAPNLNIIGEHLADKFGLERQDDDYAGAALPGAFVSMVKHMIPWQCLWVLDNNGCLHGITRDKDQQVAAWHTHEIAGTNGDVEEMAIGHGTVEYKPKILAISSVSAGPIDDEEKTGEYDQLWMAVRRMQGTVGSDPDDDSTSTWEEIVCLEKMSPPWDRGRIDRSWNNDPVVAPIYMDGCVYHDSVDDAIDGTALAPAASTGYISFPHGSVGDQISVIKDGVDLGEFTLDENHLIDIESQLTAAEIAGDEDWKAIAGYNYTATLRPVVSEVPAQTGSSIGQIRRIDQLSIHFYRSLGVRFGRAIDDNQDSTPRFNPEVVQFPSHPTDTTQPQPLFTGEKVFNFPPGYDRRARVLIESYRPLPCSITYIVARQVVNEG